MIYTIGLKKQLKNETTVSMYVDDITLRCTEIWSNLLIKTLKISNIGLMN